MHFDDNRSFVLILLFLASIFGATGSEAAQTITQEPRNAGYCSLGLAELVIITGTATDGTNLVASVRWGTDPGLPPTAEIRLLDGAGTVLASTLVPTWPGGATDHVLPGALAGPALGTAYRLVILDPGTLQPLSPEHPFRLTLAPSGGSYIYKTVQRLGTSSTWISTAMLQALDNAEAAAANDLLGHVLANAPQLTGEVWALAWLLDQLDAQTGWGKEPCACFWLPAVGADPSGSQQLYQQTNFQVPNYPDWSHGGWRGPGAEMGLGLQAVDTSTSLSHIGTSEVVMDMRCWRLDAWSNKSAQIEGPGSATVTFRLPRAEPCDSECEGRIEQSSEWFARADFEAYTWDPMAESSATSIAEAEYRVAQRSLYSGAAGGSVHSPKDESSASDLICTFKSGREQHRGRRFAAELEVHSTISLQVNPGAYAYTEVNTRPFLQAEGLSACTVEEESTVSFGTPAFTSTGKDGGLILDKWMP